MAGVSKQLTCPRCEQVMAAAVFRVLGGLRITTPDGVFLPPVTGHLLLTIAEQRLESASAEDHPEAKWRLDFIECAMQVTGFMTSGARAVITRSRRHPR